MSAQHDGKEKFKLIGENVYQVAFKGSQPAPQKPRAPRTSSAVLKAGQMNSPTPTRAQIQVGKYVEADLSKVSTKEPLSNQAILGMKQNLDRLTGLQSRLKFVLQELEDLVLE